MAEINDTYDIVIIGAGVGGGTMATQLAGAGAKVLMIERGGRLPPEADTWSVKKVFHERAFATDETWRDGDGQEFSPAMYYYVGGNSKFFGAATVRFRERDFEEVEHLDGIAPAWPISYAEFAPYYDQAEHLMGTHGQHGEDPIEPARSGPFPHPAVPHEDHIADVAERLRGQGLSPFHLPQAVDMHAGGACIRCKTCDGFACRIGAKNDAEMRLVNPALDTGNVDLVLHTKVLRLLTDQSGKRIQAVEVEQDGNQRIIKGGTFISAAGAINSAALLLRSANDKHPKGLGNSASDQLGRNYMAHNNTAMMAIHPFKKNPVTFQKTLCINDFYFENKVKPYPLGNVQGLGKLQAGMLTARARWAPEWAMGYFTNRSVDWWIMSEDLPDPSNRVTVDPDGKIRLAFTPNNLTAHNELVAHWGKVMRKIGLPLVITQRMDIKFSIHQCGTARFGTDPESSVLDPWCKVWDIDNLYVVDASFLPSSAGFNPSLTIVAQGVRAAESILNTALVKPKTSASKPRTEAL